MNPKNTIFIYTLNSSKKWCGVDKVFLSSLEIENKNISISPIVRAKTDIARKLQSLKIPHKKLPSFDVTHLTSLLKMWIFFKKTPPHFFVVHTAKEYFYGFILKVFFPKIFLIYTRHNSYLLNRPTLFFAKHSHVHWIAVSFYVRKKLLSQNISNKNITVIQNHFLEKKKIALSEITPFLKSFQIPKSTFKVGYLGRIEKAKGIESFLKTCVVLEKKHPNRFSFLIAGKTDKRIHKKKFETLLKKINQSNIHYLGFVEENLLFLASLHLLVIPSTKKCEEAFCLTALESLRQKTPVLATKYGGISEILTHKKNAFIVKSANENEIADGVETLSHDKKLVKTLTHGGQKTIEQFSKLPIISKKLTLLYLDLFEKIKG